MGEGTNVCLMTKTTEEQLSDAVETIKALTPLIEIVPDIKAMAKERQEQEIFNRRAAKIGRFIMLIAGAVGTMLATMYAVAKLIVTLGK